MEYEVYGILGYKLESIMAMMMILMMMIIMPVIVLPMIIDGAHLMEGEFILIIALILHRKLLQQRENRIYCKYLPSEHFAGHEFSENYI